MKNFELRIKNSPITHPPSGTQNKRLLSNRGPQNKPRLRLFALGRRKAEVRVASTMTDSVIGLRNLVTERDTNYQLPITNPPIGYPKVNQDYVCLQKNGVSKVNQDLSVCFGEKESGGTSCFNDDRVIGLRNLVTERGASSKLLISPLGRTIIRRANFHNSLRVYYCSLHNASFIRFIASTMILSLVA